MVLDGRRPRQIGRGGKWKVWLPSMVLRTTFRHLKTNLRATARLSDSSHSSVRDTRSAVAEVLHQAQGMQIRNLAGDDGKWFIMRLMFDETQFAVKLAEEPAAVSSIFWCHGTVCSGQDRDVVKAEELVMPPLAVKEVNAEGLLAGLRGSLPGHLGLEELLAQSDRSCLQITTDAAATNHLIAKHLASRLPRQACLLYQRCFHHQASLALKVATLYLGFLPNLFCTAKAWQSGTHLRRLRLAVKRVLRDNLERDVSTPPDAENLGRMDHLLRTCFSSAQTKDGAEDEAKADASQREKDAALLKRAFNGDLRSLRVIRHHCQGCCANREESVELCYKAFCTLLQRSP